MNGNRKKNNLGFIFCEDNLGAPQNKWLKCYNETFKLLNIKPHIISSFKEKPVLDQWINIGYFYIKKSMLTEMKKYEKFEHFLFEMINKRKICGFKHTGSHITVNTVKELEEAEININQIENKILGNK